MRLVVLYLVDVTNISHSDHKGSLCHRVIQPFRWPHWFNLINQLVFGLIGMNLNINLVWLSRVSGCKSPIVAVAEFAI